MEICHIPVRFPTINSDIIGHRISRNHDNPSFIRCTMSADNLKPRNRMMILGMGYVGQCFAHHLKNLGWVVSGTCTSIMNKKKLEEKGFDDIHLFDANVLEPSTLNTLKDYTHLIVSIPTIAGIGDPMLLLHRELCSGLKDGNLQWLSYLSSTSVYGNCDGNWVDEKYLANPTSESARLRLAAEDGWLSLGHNLGTSVQIFRLAGIYGPGRSAVDTILKEPLSSGQKRRASKQYTSRVHINDICQALKAAIDTPSSGKIYNVVDDDPTPREEVFAFAQTLVEKKWPGFIKPDKFLHESELFAKEQLKGEKRVSNARMKKDLGVRLLYPSYISGLQNIIDNLENPFLNCSSDLLSY